LTTYTLNNLNDVNLNYIQNVSSYLTENKVQLPYKTSQLIVFTEINGTFIEDHTGHINTMCDKIRNLLLLQQVVNTRL
jgi:hypothetical protein